MTAVAAIARSIPRIVGPVDLDPARRGGQQALVRPAERLGQERADRVVAEAAGAHGGRDAPEDRAVLPRPLRAVSSHPRNFIQNRGEDLAPAGWDRTNDLWE